MEDDEDAVHELCRQELARRVLGWEMADDPHEGIRLLPSDDTGFRIRFLSSREKKAGQNQMHFDLTSTLRPFTLVPFVDCQR